MTLLGGAALAYFLVSRLAYAGGVSWLLHRQWHEQYFTVSLGVEGGYRRFRQIAAWLMTNDGVAFVLLAAATAGSLGLAWPVPLRVALGVALCAAGIAVKLWAATLLGSNGYHWRNFFGPYVEHEITDQGPYRWFRNPMYTVGYLQTYGLALILDSWPALVGAVVAQASILLFYYRVEKPHFEQLVRGTLTAEQRRVRKTEARRSARG